MENSPQLSTGLETPERHWSFSPRKLGGGIALIVLGILFLCDSIGVMDIHDIWRFWALIPLGFGVAGVFFPRSGERRSTSFWLLGVGIYLVFSNFNIMGFEYGNAWPIILIFSGIGIIWGSMFERDPERTATPRVEDRHER